MPDTFIGLIGMIFLIFIAWEVIATLLLGLVAWSQVRQHDAALYSDKSKPPEGDRDHDARL